ncbi:MAG: ABC transporter substrate-binding protein [Hyphomicrobiales bacterium]|nr:ABC transporter substrate-binding protein [Hyphomicrobiales bacterium]MCP5372404.1 ABC transporter substrate-binding protein [Hyphomicrobiales bacterium]
MQKKDDSAWPWRAVGRRRVIALALAAAAGLGISGGIAGSALAADKVVIGALRFTSHAPTFIAYEKGYFKDEGLDAEIKFFQAAQPIAVAIASGDIDFGITALTGGFYNLAAKGALKVVGGLYTEDTKHNGMAIMASNKAFEAGLKTPADIKGHSWAMTQQGSSFHYMAGMIAAKYGFPLSDISVKPLQKVGAMIGAVKSGQVDAMAMVPHVAVPLDKAGAAKIIGWVRDLGDYQVTTIFTSTNNVQNNRDKVERFMRAYKRAIADYRAVMLDPAKDPAATEAMVDIIHKYVYTDRPRDKAAGPIKAGAVYLAKDAALDMADLKRQLAWFQAQGFAPKDLSVDAFVAPGFVDSMN